MGDTEQDNPSSEKYDSDTVYASAICSRTERDIWAKEAEENRYQSRAKYLRAMIHAGRREFGIAESDDQSRPDQTVTGLKSRVLANLSTEPTNFDDLVDIITAKIENDVEQCLEELAEEEKIDYTGRGGVYKMETE